VSVSIDPGTMWIVKGEIDSIDDSVSFERERNVFAEVRDTLENPEEILKDNEYSYLKYKNHFYVIGEDVFKVHEIESLFKKSGASSYFSDVRRPMKDGLINTAEEKMSIAIIQEIIRKIVGRPSKKDEVLCFCAPGDPINSDSNVLFHKTILANFIKSLGYRPEHINEALAIIFSECPIAEDPNEPEGIAKFSGIAFSFGAGACNVALSWKQLPLLSFSVRHCIPAGNKVITLDGFKSIENILSSDFVLTRKGEWAKVINVNKKLSGDKIYTFTALGQCKFSTTEDHKILINRDSGWEWIRADDVKIGDKVQQPWPVYHDKKHSISWTNEKTGEYENKYIYSKGCYVLGRFLGDGSIFKDSKSDRGIEICCNILDTSANYLSSCMSSVFERTPEIVRREEENVLEIKIHDSGLGKWFRKNTYSNNHKVVPWNISDFRENNLRFIMAGIIDGDGYASEEKLIINIEITSPSVAQFSYLALSKLGLKPSIAWRDRSNESHFYNGKEICPTKESFIIQCAGSRCEDFIQWMKNKKLFFDKTEIDGCTVAKITDIHIRENEQNEVYDITVDDESHSFCLAGCVVHNCGDWIDEEAAKIAGCDVATITKFKEKHLDLSDVNESNLKESALSIYYGAMIENAVKLFASKFEALDEKIDTPLEIVVAGGTASISGFVTKFKKVLENMELPFNIKNVRLAKNPLYAVCNGCLVKAISVESKLEKTKQEKKIVPQSPEKSSPKEDKEKNKDFTPKKIKLK